MDTLILFAILVGVFVITAPIMALLALSKISALHLKIKKLDEDSYELRRDVERLYRELGAIDKSQSIKEHESVAAEPMAESAPAVVELTTLEPPFVEEVVETISPQVRLDPVIEHVVQHEKQVQPEQEIKTQSTSAAQVTKQESHTATTTQETRQSKAAQMAAQLSARRQSAKNGETLHHEKSSNVIARWFTSGNVPVKVGVLILFAGVAALFKYISDQGWFTVSIQSRLLGVAALAVGAFIFAWRKKETHRVFSLSLQGGAIGVLLLTLYAACKIYPFVPVSIAFGITVLLIMVMGVLAVKQNAMAMAVLAVLAGFLAPIWLSTGSGNYIALFTYYAILNAGIFGMAWYRPWRHLNMLGFVFTFGIGIMWGVLDYSADKFAITEPFLLLFFVFYLLIPIFYARRYEGESKNITDAALVFGTPLVAFSIQAVLLEGSIYTLAACSLGLGILYAGLAKLFSNKARLKELVSAYTVLAAGFVTLAVPLAFSAQQTSCIYALEGAALVWWGARQDRFRAQVSGIALQALAAFAFLLTAEPLLQADAFISKPFFDASFINMLIIAGAGLASAWGYYKGNAVNLLTKKYLGNQKILTSSFYIWGAAWWLAAMSREIYTHVQIDHIVGALLILLAVTGWISAEVYSRGKKPLLSILAFSASAAVVIGLPMIAVALQMQDHLFKNFNGAAWGIFVIIAYRIILCLRGLQLKEAKVAQYTFLLIIGLIATVELRWLVWQLWREPFPAAFSNSWFYAAIATPLMVMLAASLWRWNWLRTPLGEEFNSCRFSFQSLLFIIGGLMWVKALTSSGSSAPLPWIPLLNPIDLMQLVFIAMFYFWNGKGGRGSAGITTQLRAQLIAAGLFTLASTIVLRAVHHFSDFGWGIHLLQEPATQTSLSIVWSALGVLAWIYGSRKEQRTIWWVGAILMGIVLGKLLLIDRLNLGNVMGILSFIAYGLLCVVVGYFAPAPPPKALDRSTAQAQ